MSDTHEHKEEHVHLLEHRQDHDEPEVYRIEEDGPDIIEADDSKAGFDEVRREQDAKHGEGHFDKYCWPIIQNFGVEKWQSLSKAVQETLLTVITQKPDVKDPDAAGIDWAAFKTQTLTLVD
jgi:hypothetical protein